MASNEATEEEEVIMADMSSGSFCAAFSITSMWVHVVHPQLLTARGVVGACWVNTNTKKPRLWLGCEKHHTEQSFLELQALLKLIFSIL